MSKNALSHREAAHVLCDMLIASGFRKAYVWDKEREETRVDVDGGFMTVCPKTQNMGQVRVFGNDAGRFKQVVDDFDSRFVVVPVAKREMALQRGRIY